MSRNISENFSNSDGKRINVFSAKSKDAGYYV